MKKLVLLFAAATLAVSASAQTTVAGSKAFDNVYIGINGGVATKMTGHSWLGDLDPNAGLRIGKNITPVFGLAVESNAYFSNKPWESTGTVVRALNTSLLGTLNLSNMFGGYKGDPRVFEVSALYGIGWGHVFLHANEGRAYNRMTSKAGLDFAFNLGKNKAWQIYIEPSVTWVFNGQPGTTGYNSWADPEYKLARNANQGSYNINNAAFQVNAGIVYKFKNHDGRHNFTIVTPRDQAEIDGLNAQINDLRNQLNGKDNELNAKNRRIADLQKALDECNAKPKYVKPETATNLQPTVLFRQGKSVIDKAQYAPIELIANYMNNNKNANVEVRGYASPEGSKELNQKLSEARANAVKNALVKKYKIDANRLTTKGFGATDKLFKQVEFNRVVTFNDANSAD